jgi:hypothetical protein
LSARQVVLEEELEFSLFFLFFNFFFNFFFFFLQVPKGFTALEIATVKLENFYKSPKVSLPWMSRLQIRLSPEAKFLLCRCKRCHCQVIFSQKDFAKISVKKLKNLQVPKGFTALEIATVKVEIFYKSPNVSLPWKSLQWNSKIFTSPQTFHCLGRVACKFGCLEAKFLLCRLQRCHCQDIFSQKECHCQDIFSQKDCQILVQKFHCLGASRLDIFTSVSEKKLAFWVVLLRQLPNFCSRNEGWKAHSCHLPEMGPRGRDKLRD